MPFYIRTVLQGALAPGPIGPTGPSVTGPTGPTGTTGPSVTGPTGPSVTGPTGATGSAGPNTINTASDVDTTALTDGSVLVYAQTTSKWTATLNLNKQNLDGGEF